ncbi:Pol-like protein [Plakobranchus ocellatus]|uniref:Pol-like protein n=1 Tax=Plakobranchus ocellatus TaxID=259542 RepID=A0AAV4C7I3_9GAST|nr:Pol-like protein [Plakobranchus ocellatus]
MCRLRVGHTWLTQSYLLKNEEQPFCYACDSLYTVRHILIEGPDFQDTRRKYFNDGGRSAPSAPPKGKKAHKDSPAPSPQGAAETEVPAKRRAEKSKRQEAPREIVNPFARLAMDAEDTISSIWGGSSTPSSPRASASLMEGPTSPSKPQSPSKSRPPPPGGETPRSSAFPFAFLSLHPRSPCDGGCEACKKD